MTAEEWREVEELFHQASGLPPDSRARWVRQACAGNAAREQAILEMLAADESQAGDGVLRTVADAAGTWLMESEPAPTRAGPWKLIRLIGSGGMGSVYLASRDDAEYSKQAAVKLLRRGFEAMGARERFLQERQILAGLDHPHIARMLDGGTTADGRPYLVMEYVDGESLAGFVKPLSLAERCRLFATVCDAVAYAHQRLIVHRDLKPANIMVDRHGTPKLLDFGVAKLLDKDRNAPGLTQAIFTADYASPEQLNGRPVTTATDVYSLGAILYELIAGQPAHALKGNSFAELVATVCDRDVEKPSRRAARKISADLDNIVLKAMARDPERRYRTAYEFAEDLRRFLGNRPVKARPPSWTYVTGKFVRRNVLTVSVIAALMACLAASAAWSFRSAREAERQRVRAAERSANLRKLTQHLLFDVQASLDGVVGATRARQMLVKLALEHFEKMLAEDSSDPLLRRDLSVAYTRIGDVQGWPANPNLADLSGAVRSYRRALDLIPPLAPEWALEIQRSGILLHMAETYGAWGKAAEAESAFAEALGAVPRDAGDSREQRIARLSRLFDIYRARAWFLAQQGDSVRRAKDEAASAGLLDAALKLDPASPKLRQLEIIRHTNDGFSLLDDHRYAEALVQADLGLALAVRMFETDRSHRAIHHQMRAQDLRNQILANGDFPGRNLAAALDAANAAVARARQLLDSEPGNSRSMGELSEMVERRAQTLEKLRRYPEALADARQAIGLNEQATRLQPENAVFRGALGLAQYRVGSLLEESGKPAEALAWYARSAATFRAVMAEAPSDAAGLSLMVLERTGDLERKLGHRDAAAKAYREGLNVFQTQRRIAARTDPAFAARVAKKLGQ